MFVQSLVEGLLFGGYMGIVIGPLAIWSSQMRLRYGWRYAIAIAMGGAIGDLVIAIVATIASVVAGNQLTLVLYFLENRGIQGAGLLLLGCLFIGLVWVPVKNKPSREIPNVVALAPLFILGVAGALYLPENYATVGAATLYFKFQGLAIMPLLVAYTLSAFATWIASIEVLARIGARVGQKLMTIAIAGAGGICVLLGVVRIVESFC